MRIRTALDRGIRRHAFKPLLAVATFLVALVPSAHAAAPAAVGYFTAPRIVGIASTPNGRGAWLVSQDGRVEWRGNAEWYGDLAGVKLNQGVVGVASTSTGLGYWIVAGDGGIFSFGDAQFWGSMGGKALNAPVVSMAPTPTHAGYWLVATDGGIFSFGDAQFYGSMGGQPLNKPVNGMTVSPFGAGYRMVASDGGIFSFGDAMFFGSLGGAPPASPIVGFASTPSNLGYWLLSNTGDVYEFGDAHVSGIFPSVVHLPGSAPAVGITNDSAEDFLGSGACPCPGDAVRVAYADGSVRAAGWFNSAPLQTASAPMNFAQLLRPVATWSGEVPLPPLRTAYVEAPTVNTEAGYHIRFEVVYSGGVLDPLPSPMATTWEVGGWVGGTPQWNASTNTYQWIGRKGGLLAHLDFNPGGLVDLRVDRSP